MERTGSPNDKLLEELIRGNSEVLFRARELEKILTEGQLAWRPPQGGWTAGQLFEHLVISGRLYVDRLDGIMERARAEGRVRARAWKPSIMGGVIMRSVNPLNTKRRPTQKIFTPGPTARPHVIRELIELHEQLALQMKKAEGLDLRGVRLSSPVSSLIRLNLGDAFGILVFHAQRHMLQIGRVITTEGFPGLVDARPAQT